MGSLPYSGDVELVTDALADLRALKNVPCPEGGGDGSLTYVGGPGYFSPGYGNWLPSETEVECDTCGGDGTVPGCAVCGEVERDCMCCEDALVAYTVGEAA